MKSAGSPTLALLAAGQYLKFEFYAITLVDGTVLRFTNADVSLTVGGQTYLTGLTLTRSSFRQKVGLEVQSLTIDAAPQPDNPAGAITVAGYPFLQAVNLGVFDGARVLVSKGFFGAPVLGKIDTSPGLVAWAQGKVSDAVATRSIAHITVADDTQALNVAMPRNVLQTGCVHSLFGSGCGLSEASFQVSGSVSGSPTVRQLGTSLTNPNGHFDLGRIRFTSGPNSGLRRTVKAYLNASGQITLIDPLPVAPGSGDTFVALPGCDKQQATCSAKFSNLARFRGFPYIPVPETLYDGGTPSTTVPTVGSQGGPSAGSNFSGKAGKGSYAG